MKFYRESLRRLSRIGLTLLILTIVATVIYALQGVAAGEALMPVNAVQLMPVLPFYAYLAGVGFAFTGFSFLNRRSESDFYHSIPVSRASLFLSVTLAALTWIGVTVVLSSAVCAVIMLAAGAPFVTLYVPLNMLFYIVAAMLVFAAAAIGVSVTGTLLTNMILTCVVLFLPRFLLFIIARGIVANVSIVGWLDLPWLLQPSANAATGLIVMLSRQMFIGRIVSLGSILYSTALAALEIALGCFLFVRRPSELAEQGAVSRKMQTLFASLVALPVLLLTSVLASRTGTYRSWATAILVAASFTVYLIYQIIVLKNRRKVLLSLPWYLCCLAVTAGVLLCIDGTCKSYLAVCPAPEEIESVTFKGYDGDQSLGSYTSLELSQLAFTEESVRTCVSENLAREVEGIRNGTPDYYYYGDTYTSTEPIVIRLTNGRKIHRTIRFEDVDALNAARAENPRFDGVVHAFPPAGSVRHRSTWENSSLSEEDVEKLRVCYFDECAKNNLVPNGYYRAHDFSVPEGALNYSSGEDQGYGSFTVGGFIGTKRYRDNYSISLETPKSAALWMKLVNRTAAADNLPQMAAAFAAIQRSQSPRDSFDLSVSLTNLPLQEGNDKRYQLGFSSYISGNDDERLNDTEGNNYYRGQLEYAEKMMDILKRGTPTEDPTALNAYVSWNTYYEGVYYGNNCGNINGNGFRQYLAFSPADEKALIELVIAWRADEENSYMYYGDTDAAADAAEDHPDAPASSWAPALPAPTPTPMPVPIP